MAGVGETNQSTEQQAGWKPVWMREQERQKAEKDVGATATPATPPFAVSAEQAKNLLEGLTTDYSGQMRGTKVREAGAVARDQKNAADAGRFRKLIGGR